MISFQDFIGAFLVPKKYSELDEIINDKAIERKIISRLSRGNVSLQSGHYQTKEDISERVQKVTQHKFI